MSRTSAPALLARACGPMAEDKPMPIEEHICPVRALTRGPKAHFFGYYDKPPWDAAGRRVLAMEAEPVNRMPLPGEKAGICLIDLESGTAERIAETTAWNWQQGCMLQWLAPAADSEIIYNLNRRMIGLMNAEDP